MSERGKYIVIEGHDGTGKSEQAKRLRTRLGAEGILCARFIVEEPDGARDEETGEYLVPVATELRKIIKNGLLHRSPQTNVSMFNDARRENWLQAMKPALDRGEWIVTARNWLSTVAYQGYGEGIDISEIESAVLRDVGDEYMNPDLALILDLQDERIRVSRIGGRGELEVPDTFESKPGDFQSRVRFGYLDYAERHGIPILDASGDRDVVEEHIWQRVKEII